MSIFNNNNSIEHLQNKVADCEFKLYNAEQIKRDVTKAQHDLDAERDAQCGSPRWHEMAADFDERSARLREAARDAGRAVTDLKTELKRLERDLQKAEFDNKAANAKEVRKEFEAAVADAKVAVADAKSRRAKLGKTDDKITRQMKDLSEKQRACEERYKTQIEKSLDSEGVPPRPKELDKIINNRQDLDRKRAVLVEKISQADKDIENKQAILRKAEVAAAEHDLFQATIPYINAQRQYEEQAAFIEKNRLTWLENERKARQKLASLGISDAMRNTIIPGGMWE